MKNHNMWFRSVSLSGRKSCPRCKEKLGKGEKIWSCGEYVRGKWNTVWHFCKVCYGNEIKERMWSTGFDLTFIGYGGEQLPKWLTLRSRK